MTKHVNIHLDGSKQAKLSSGVVIESKKVHLSSYSVRCETLQNMIMLIIKD